MGSSPETWSAVSGGRGTGSVATVFALVALPLICLLGSAVDFTRASVQQARLQAASDAAVLAGVVAAKTELDRGTVEATALAAARGAAQAFFQSNFGTGATFDARFGLSGLTISGNGTASFAQANAFMGLFGFRARRWRCARRRRRPWSHSSTSTC